MSTDIKLTKAQTSKIIQSGVSWLAVLDTKALKNVAIPLTRDNLPRLVSNLASNVINTFERKINGKELWEQEKNLLYLFWIKIWMILLKS